MGILVSEATFDAREILGSNFVEMGITGTENSTYSGSVTIYSSLTAPDGSALADGKLESDMHSMSGVTLSN